MNRNALSSLPPYGSVLELRLWVKLPVYRNLRQDSRFLDLVASYSTSSSHRMASAGETYILLTCVCVGLPKTQRLLEMLSDAAGPDYKAS